MAILRNVSVACPADGSVIGRDLHLATRAGAPHRFEKRLSHHIVLPALVNAHDHLHQNGVPRLPQAAPFGNSYEWAATFRSHFADPGVKAVLATPLAARLWHGALKNALSGVTLVMHHDPAHGALQDANFPVSLPQACGWAHSLHLPYGPQVLDSFRATAGVVPWFIHLAEGVDALAAGELDELKQLGCLGDNSVLIHGVGFDDADVADVIRAGAGVVWCPSSNLSLLGASIAPQRLRALFAADCLALGTDSRLTGARDLLAELRVAAAHSDFTPRELLQLVTGRARRMLRAAADDDCIIVRDGGGDPFRAPLEVTRAQLRAVVRHGAPLIADPDFADWFDALGIAFTLVHLDGVPKLCRSDVLAPRASASWMPEPGLTLQ